MKMIIIAGGRGERLRPITDTIPKPMIEVQGKPILEHILLHAKKHGITEFIFALCYLPEKITSYFDDGEKWEVHIDYVYEKSNNPLGSAGGIIPAKRYINDTFIVTYSDILRDLNIKTMINDHKCNKRTATINVYKRYGKDPKSMIIFDKKGRVIDFKERPSSKNITEDFVWANGSFYIFEPQIFDFIPHDRQSDFATDVFPKLLKNNKNIYAFPTEGYFIDMGTKDKLEKARKTYLNNG